VHENPLVGSFAWVLYVAGLLMVLSGLYMIADASMRLAAGDDEPARTTPSAQASTSTGGRPPAARRMSHAMPPSALSHAAVLMDVREQQQEVRRRSSMSVEPGGELPQKGGHAERRRMSMQVFGTEVLDLVAAPRPRAASISSAGSLEKATRSSASPRGDVIRSGAGSQERAARPSPEPLMPSASPRGEVFHV
jgi:hypothetical protein